VSCGGYNCLGRSMIVAMKDRHANCPSSGGFTTFCPDCGVIQADPKAVAARLKGGIGIHSPSPAMEEFFRTGDPEVFAPKTQ